MQSRALFGLLRKIAVLLCDDRRTLREHRVSSHCDLAFSTLQLYVCEFELLLQLLNLVLSIFLVHIELEKPVVHFHLLKLELSNSDLELTIDRFKLTLNVPQFSFQFLLITLFLLAQLFDLVSQLNALFLQNRVIFVEEVLQLPRFIIHLLDFVAKFGHYLMI